LGSKPVFYLIKENSLLETDVKQNKLHLDVRQRIAAYLAATLMLFLCAGVSAASEALKQAVEYVSSGKWDAAMSVLQSESEASDPRIETHKGLLLEHQALDQRRQQQRQAVFEEKCQAFDVVDPNSLDEAALLKAMELFKAVWDNATVSERDELPARPVFQTLRKAARERFASDEEAGRWDAAWSKWLRWLLEFEPSVYQKSSDDLQERRMIANALRKNPCNENAIPYSQVNRETAVRIFDILQNQYAEEVSFDRIAAKGLRRLARLPEVFRNPAITFAVQADPIGFTDWAGHMEQLQTTRLPTSGGSMTALLDMLSGINQTTLKLPEGVIIAQFTEAALAALDPYTEAVWPESVGLFEKNLTGQFGGIGIRIKKDGDNLVIVSVIPDTPAAATSLAADDVIVAVDGRMTREMTTDCAVSRISGPVGTAVSLTVHRPGTDKDEIVTVMRHKIGLPTVEGSQRADNGRNEGHWDYFLDAKDRIGYLQLNGFTEKTAEQARQVIEQLERNQVAGLIVDVRGNGGGLLSEATAFADLFVDDGVLLSSRGRGDKETTWQAKSNAVKCDYPVVILIDEGSASASEIVAGVLAVRKPGQTTLIGQRTYGKGTVQEVVDLGPAGGRLKYTSAYYFLPDKRPVQNRYKLQAEGRTDWGITPAIELPLYAYEKTHIQQIQIERRKQLMAKEPQQDSDAKAESLVQQMLMADAQLSAALVVLKAKILAVN
jgi:carboxyl-terminal processing protease